MENGKRRTRRSTKEKKVYNCLKRIFKNSKKVLKKPNGKQEKNFKNSLNSFGR